MNFRVDSAPLEGRAHLVALTGEVDLYTAPELKQALLKAIEGGSQRIVVDLTDTTFIDSTTLGVLLSAVKRLRPGGGEVVVVCHDRNIRKIFEITLLDRVFPIYDARDDAIGRVERAD